MSWEILLLLFFAGLTAGFIDAIAGGGGLITVPALLWAGLDPRMALGTNKMQSVFGTAMAVRRYAGAGLVSWREVRLAVLVTFLAAAAGTWVVTLVSNEILAKIVPWLLLALAFYVLASPRLGAGVSRERLGNTAFALVAGAVLGFYDGFFGPGTGAFWTLACLALRGMELTRSIAFTKVTNLTSNAASLLVFLGAGLVRFDVAAAMIAGQLLGGRLGAGMAIRHGAPFIRVIFVSVVLALTGKLLWDQLFR
ncbi:MAG: TSUP family transporter [Verrucomicrobiae bacterium]|nr:TSUP family transporter [Verrucomicrobiae bacterium]